jgi:hypothetical protein
MRVIGADHFQLQGPRLANGSEVIGRVDLMGLVFWVTIVGDSLII